MPGKRFLLDNYGVEHVAIGLRVAGFVVDDQLQPLVKGDLDVVARFHDLTTAERGPIRTRSRCGAAIRINQRDLHSPSTLNLREEFEQMASMRLEGVRLMVKHLCGETRGIRLGRVAVVEIVEVDVDWLVQLRWRPLGPRLSDAAGAVRGSLGFPIPKATSSPPTRA